MSASFLALTVRDLLAYAALMAVPVEPITEPGEHSFSGDAPIGIRNDTSERITVRVEAWPMDPVVFVKPGDVFKYLPEDEP